MRLSYVLMLVLAALPARGDDDPTAAFALDQPAAAEQAPPAPPAAAPLSDNRLPAELQAWVGTRQSEYVAPTRRYVKLPPRPSKRIAAISPPLPGPNDLYTLALKALLQTPQSRWFETRFITYWPLPDAEYGNVELALKFWLASLSNRRQVAALHEVPGLGWKVFLSDYGWDAAAWEALIKDDPYFAVSSADPKYVARGWLDPLVEGKLRIYSQSRRAVVRADRFLALTATDAPDGFYSKFVKLPDNEGDLFKLKGIDVDFLNKNALLRGGAVLGGASIVAKHNRELQLLPSPIGLDERYLWRSLDTLSDVGKESVIDNFLGTVRFAGKEYIGTNPNGTHYYYLANAQNKQVGEVPTKIAQDRQDPHDATVITPYKCVSCHGPKGGIRHFDDAIRQIALSKDVGLAVVTKGYYGNTQLREALEDYYLSPLGQEITKQQVSYTRVISELTGLSPAENAENFIKFVNHYLHGLVDKQSVCRELGVEPEQIDAYLKQTGNPVLLAILSGKAVPRLAFESAFRDGMTSRIHPWERTPKHVPYLDTAPAIAKPGGHSGVKQPGKH